MARRFTKVLEEESEEAFFCVAYTKCIATLC